MIRRTVSRQSRRSANLQPLCLSQRATPLHFNHPTMPPSPATPSRAPSSSSSQRTPSQWLFTKSETRATPSIKEGLDPKQERSNRFKGIQFIDRVGRKLRLHQHTIATAAMFFHRFFMRQTMQRFHYYVHPLPPCSVTVPSPSPSLVRFKDCGRYCVTHCVTQLTFPRGLLCSKIDL
jgi:hypothetical protein